MKKTATLLVTIALLLNFTMFSQSKEVDIRGEWEDKEMNVEYNFSSNTKASFSQMGYGMSVSYKIDFSKSPYWIDFTLERAGNKMKMPGLLRIINTNTRYGLSNFLHIQNILQNFLKILLLEQERFMYWYGRNLKPYR